jgi:alpha-glucosidase
MNEIATWGNALPENIVFDFDGNPASTRRGRNVFGFQMARSTYEGTKKLLGGKRPFNLTRSGFAGVQRYAAVWTGDNVSYDEHMLLGVRLVNSLGLTGISFAGYDVGGFVGDANTKLYARWISIGALSPFFRGHTMINSRDSEPWSYGEEVEQIARNYVKFRYQLLPYLYSLFDDASRTGLPVQRSLAIPYTHDPLIYQGTYHNQYLLGPFILVAPVESSRELAKVYLPEGSWYYLFDGKHYQGNEEIIVDSPIHRLPVFIKGGAIIPMQSAVAHTGEKTEELIVHVYHGSDPTEFTWYSDDGQTFDYQNGNYSRRVFSFIPSERKIKIGATEGSFSTHFKKIKFVFHRFEAFNVEIDGTAFNLRREAFSFFTAMEKYDPIADPESMGEEMVSSTEVEYTAGAIEVHW